MSKHHCRLLLQNGQLVVEDLGSTNGTYVNGRKITEATAISITDKVFVGDFVIRLAGGVAQTSRQQASRHRRPTGLGARGRLAQHRTTSAAPAATTAATARCPARSQ